LFLTTRHELRNRRPLATGQSASVNWTLAVFGELIAANPILAFYRYVPHRAIVAVLNAGAALCVQQIKGDALILGGFVELNANRYQPEGE
jgi:hypothetical protein